MGFEVNFSWLFYVARAGYFVSRA